MFDVDEHPKIPDARQMATANGIHLAISNPCIELWLLLHFRETPGMINRGKAKQLLKDYLPNYDKKIDYKDYEKGYSAAVIRAEVACLAADAASEIDRNPTTTVYLLTEQIRTS